jgi:hypothetical protein
VIDGQDFDETPYLKRFSSQQPPGNKPQKIRVALLFQKTGYQTELRNVWITRWSKNRRDAAIGANNVHVQLKTNDLGSDEPSPVTKSDVKLDAEPSSPNKPAVDAVGP